MTEPHAPAPAPGPGSVPDLFGADLPAAAAEALADQPERWPARLAEITDLLLDEIAVRHPSLPAPTVRRLAVRLTTCLAAALGGQQWKWPASQVSEPMLRDQRLWADWDRTRDGPHGLPELARRARLPLDQVWAILCRQDALHRGAQTPEPPPAPVPDPADFSLTAPPGPAADPPERWPARLAMLTDLLIAELTAARTPPEPPAVRRLAVHLTARLACELRGQQWYWPMAIAVERLLRDQRIWAEHDGTVPGPHGIEALARRYRLSQNQIWKVLRAEDARHRRRLQPDLPGLPRPAPR